MPNLVHLELDLPADLDRLRLPAGVDERLQELLDRQDRGESLSPRERREAEGLVNLAELLTLLRLRSEGVNDCCVADESATDSCDSCGGNEAGPPPAAF